ncbi:MAG: ABC transporter ATP-binding protein [Alphaproteobacteria bacterium]|nr:ABC transporter ATP-binding protein [Alphaproteobacteria bacterium]
MAEPAARETVLETRKLGRLFGGLAAVQDVSLTVERGRVHAIVGPNGAGKTTLINLLSGDLKPSAGTVGYEGRDITGWPAHRVARLGIGRSYQKTNIFRDFTAFENCRLAAQARLPRLSLLRPAAGHRDVTEQAAHALELCGLAERRDTRAASMSYGEQRQLELAMMLATGPQLLLLDEPLAGMGPEESARVLDLLRRLAAGHTMVMIEHDMDAVFSIADEITVMVNGSVLASGTPAEIRANKAVQDAYLGEEAPE